MNFKLVKGGSEITKINLLNMAKGIYLVKLITLKKTAVKKLVLR